MLKFICSITGDDYNLIKNETPHSIKKVKLFVVCLMIPVIMWAINSFLLVSEVLKKDFTTAIIAMIISTIIIFVIEKAIIMSNGSKSIAVFRICLGIIIALIGSLAFDEVIFKNDIDTQISENKNLYVNEHLDEKRKELSAGLMLMEYNMKSKDSIWKDAINAAIGESEGTSGSGIPNRGKITELKLQKADEYKNEYEIARTDLYNLKNSNDSIISVYENKLNSSFNENSLLLRVKALFDLVQKDGWMMTIYILFTLLIILMESMVIIVKLFSKESNYEKKMKLIEQIGEKRMNFILNNNSQVYDNVVFKGDLNNVNTLLRKPVNGMYN